MFPEKTKKQFKKVIGWIVFILIILLLVLIFVGLPVAATVLWFMDKPWLDAIAGAIIATWMILATAAWPKGWHPDEMVKSVRLNDKRLAGEMLVGHFLARAALWFFKAYFWILPLILFSGIVWLGFVNLMSIITIVAAILYYLWTCFIWGTPPAKKLFYALSIVAVTWLVWAWSLWVQVPIAMLLIVSLRSFSLTFRKHPIVLPHGDHIEPGHAPLWRMPAALFKGLYQIGFGYKIVSVPTFVGTPPIFAGTKQVQKPFPKWWWPSVHAWSTILIVGAASLLLWWYTWLSWWNFIPVLVVGILVYPLNWWFACRKSLRNVRSAFMLGVLRPVLNWDLFPIPTVFVQPTPDMMPLDKISLGTPLGEKGWEGLWAYDPREPGTVIMSGVSDIALRFMSLTEMDLLTAGLSKTPAAQPKPEPPPPPSRVPEDEFVVQRVFRWW